MRHPLSEFDLTPQPLKSKAKDLSFTTRLFKGPAQIPVLEIVVNPNGQSATIPGENEIPGLLPFKEAPGPSPWSIKASHQVEERHKASAARPKNGQGLTLSWNSHTLLQALSAPQLHAVTLDDLPGLLTHPTDKLPPGFTEGIIWDWELLEFQPFYGLGQRSGPLNRRGTTATNWTTDEPSGHSRTTDPLYQAHPILWSVTDNIWWAIHLIHSPYSRFDLGQSDPFRMRWLTLGSTLTLHVHAGFDPKAVHESLRQGWAQPTLPPLWALGFHQSRWGYRSGDEVLKLATNFSTRNLPLDVIHLDIDHMKDYRSFTFSQERFPNPQELIKNLRSLGTRVVTILDPGLRFDPGKGYDPIDSGLTGDHFLKSVSGAPIVGFCWPDEALFPNFSRQATRTWWAKCATFYLQQGVSGLWIDMNEPAIFNKPFWTGGHRQNPVPLDTPSGEKDRPSCQAAHHNLYGSQMAQATSQAWEASPDRPWVLTRAGFTGVGAYAWSWMGDNTSWWEHLKLSLPQLASMGLVGCPFVGVDIGGFFGHCSAELYSYWIEASVVYPFMRAHSALGTREAHPWSFGPEVERVAQTALRLRYRLLPYLYSAARAQSQGDQPILRPMIFDFPNEPRFIHLEDQVMFGPHLMAAPFLHPGQNERLVTLPEGDWYDFHSGKHHQGNQSLITVRRPGLTPLFARSGSIIPTLKDPVTCTDQAHGKPWNLLAFRGPDQLESRLYWDKGDGWGFQKDRFWSASATLRSGDPTLYDEEGSLQRPVLAWLRPEDGKCWSEHALTDI